VCSGYERCTEHRVHMPVVIACFPIAVLLLCDCTCVFVWILDTVHCTELEVGGLMM
jgi:hypothetical protein